MSDAPSPQRAASAEERERLEVAITLTLDAAHMAGKLSGELASILIARHLAPLLDRITAAETRAEEAEDTASDMRTLRNKYRRRAVEAEVDLIALGRMYGDACGKLANYREAAIHYADKAADGCFGASAEALNARDAATADRDRLADEMALLRNALARDARVEAILDAVLVGSGDPELSDRDHLPRALRDFLSKECGRAGLTGFNDGYAEGYAKAEATAARALTVTGGTTDGQA